MFYVVKTPWLLKKLYPSCIWDMPAGAKKIYLTFDDGPHPEITPFVLDTLKQHKAKATFFCIGRNVVSHPEVYRQILDSGHRAGNHTHDHLNGWKVSDDSYFSNVREAAKHIDSEYFRPPYGRITRFQINGLLHATPAYKIIMWDVLSGDFDKMLAPEKCASNVIRHTKDGSIVVFHDSEKAWERMKIALPRALEFFSERDINLKRWEVF